MDTGKDPSERGKHQALAVFIEDHDLKDNHIVQGTQGSNSFGFGRRYGLQAFNVCTAQYFHILGWDDTFFGSLPWKL